ncbi:hypothetical protein Tsubulata_047128 [Turnera subulata]|uniref:Uncharacterized protein n=1 Tax=Turnera subulata TaxID=218843 RepID=A0A9Q0JH40_9ROSI|nr:hypothetical protein Tsubulata_047128 [Turnera subulata]
MLYELLSGGMVLALSSSSGMILSPMFFFWEIAPRFSDLLASTGIQFFRDRVKLLHPFDHWSSGSSVSGSGGTVLLESGLLIEYDWFQNLGGNDDSGEKRCCSFTKFY